VSVAETTNW